MVERRGGRQHGHVTSVCSFVQSSSAVNFFDTTSSLALCVCAMTDAAEGHASGGEDNETEKSVAASSTPASPMPAPTDSSSAGDSSIGILEQESDLLRKIRELSDTQKALKDQKKKCSMEIKNAKKRKQRLQGKAQQLSDADLVEVLRMRKAKKAEIQTVASQKQPET